MAVQLKEQELLKSVCVIKQNENDALIAIAYHSAAFQLILNVQL